MNKQIEEAISIAQRAQRNYDLSKTIPMCDLETLIYAAANSPSKQNETHYSLKVYTDSYIIHEIYNHTKLFSLYGKKINDEVGLFEERDGKFWQDENRSVHNSQILANALFVYVDEQGPARGGTHMLGKNNSNNQSESYILYKEQRDYSVGISTGQLIMAAALLGYRTGICSAFNRSNVANIINTDKEVKLLVGIGYENVGRDRRLHAKTLNKDVPKLYQTGDPNENWQFPSFEKHIKVSFNEV